jgi:hypothetical protein
MSSPTTSSRSGSLPGGHHRGAAPRWRNGPMTTTPARVHGFRTWDSGKRRGVGRSIQMIARENPVHPVREYLNALHWDRTPRLDFAMCLRASPVLPDRIGPGVSKPLIFPVPSGRAVRGGALGRATHWNARLQLLLKLTPAK